MAEQSKTSSSIRNNHHPHSLGETTKPAKTEKLEKEESQAEERVRYITEDELAESKQIDFNSNSIHVTQDLSSDTAQDYHHNNPVANDEESDVAMPLNNSMDDELDVPVITLPTPHSFTPDHRKDLSHRGGLAGSKFMKRSSSVISDSGIESEPSSVAWPVDTLKVRHPLDFSSEREIPQQIILRHPAHRSSLEGLQMESNGSIPSGGIQASLTSISSLPYEEDQQQRQLRKLTKSVSAPQISSPEETEEKHLLMSEALCKDSDLSHLENNQIIESHALRENISFKSSVHSCNQQEMHTRKSSGDSEVLLQESIDSSHVKESAVNNQRCISEGSASVEDAHLIHSEDLPCSFEKQPSAENSEEHKESVATRDEYESLNESQLHVAESEDSPEASETPQEKEDISEPDSGVTTQRPTELNGLTVNNVTLSAENNRTVANDKEPLPGENRPAKIPNSSLAFVNKKMVEVVNMSVSCAPTCLPFSSALRDSPSISGMSARQATSPITHQPLGSFGIISSSSINPLNMDEETNERMLK